MITSKIWDEAFHKLLATGFEPRSARSAMEALHGGRPGPSRPEHLRTANFDLFLTSPGDIIAMNPSTEHPRGSSTEVREIIQWLTKAIAYKEPA